MPQAAASSAFDLDQASQLLREWRDRLHIDPFWRITLRRGDEGMEQAGSCEWQTQSWHAIVMLNPGLTVSLEWVIVHELVELLMASTGDMLVQLTDVNEYDPQHLYMLSLYKSVRNQEIERLVSALVGYPRPLDLSEVA